MKEIHGFVLSVTDQCLIAPAASRGRSYNPDSLRGRHKKGEGEGEGEKQERGEGEGSACY